MSMKTYSGSCHCGAVRFQAELDFAQGTVKCNCTSCVKARSWLILAPAARFRLVRGRGASGGISMDAARTPKADRQVSLLQGMRDSDAGAGRAWKQWAAPFTPFRSHCSTTWIAKNSPPRQSAMSTVATIASIERLKTCASYNRGGLIPGAEEWRRPFQTFAAGATEPDAPSRNCRTVILATSEAGMPSAGLRPIACNVSETDRSSVSWSPGSKRAGASQTIAVETVEVASANRLPLTPRNDAAAERPL